MTPTLCAPWLFAFAAVLGAEELRESPPIQKSPDPGFLRLPRQHVQSDFAVPHFGLAVAAKEFARPECGVDGGRTNVNFTRPVGMIVERCTIDPVETHSRPRPWGYFDFEYSYIENEWWNKISSKLRSTFVLSEDFFKILFPDLHVPGGIIAPGQADFLQGKTHRLKITQIDSARPSQEILATMEVMASDIRSSEYLSRHEVPVEFTKEDFRNVLEARTVVKVYYLPGALYPHDDDSGSDVQVATYSGVFLDGVDPVHEARQRGSVLLVIRMGVGQIFSAPLHEDNHRWIFRYSGSFR